MSDLPILSLYSPYPNRKDLVTRAQDIAQLGFHVEARSLEQQPVKGSVGLVVVRSTLTDGQLKKIRALASAEKVTFVILPDQLSQWSGLLTPLLSRPEPPKEEKIPTSVPKVSAEKMENFLRVVQAGLNGGLNWSHLVASVRPYWRPGGPSGAAELEDYVQRLVQTPERCPQFFRDWWAEHTRPTPIPAPPPSEPLVFSAPETSDTPVPEKLTESKEYKELVAMYDELEKANTALEEEVKRVSAQALELQNHLGLVQGLHAKSGEEAAAATKEAASLRRQLVEARDLLQTQMVAAAVELDAAKARVVELEEQLKKARARPAAPPTAVHAPAVGVFTREQAVAIRGMLAVGYDAAGLLEQILYKIGV